MRPTRISPKPTTTKQEPVPAPVPETPEASEGEQIEIETYVETVTNIIICAEGYPPIEIPVELAQLVIDELQTFLSPLPGEESPA